MNVIPSLYEWYNIELFLFIRMNRKVTFEEINKKFPLVSEIDLKKLVSLGKIKMDSEFYMTV